MSLVLDAGAFIAIERGSREVMVLLERERRAGRAPVTHGGVVGQVWRGAARQARLARALRGVEVAALDADLGRGAGALLARCGTEDVIDAAVVLLAADGDEILTSDSVDLHALAEASGTHLEILPL